MTAIKPTILSDAQKDKQRPEDELYDALCREVATLRRLADSDNEGSNAQEVERVVLQGNNSERHVGY